MVTCDKIYPTKISRLADWENFDKSAKVLLFKLLPLAKPIFLASLSVGVWLILQVFVVGFFDRLGVSPKISLIGSSLFYGGIFATLAIIGGLKRNEIATAVKANFNAQPICKMLIIKRKTQEMKR